MTTASADEVMFNKADIGNYAVGVLKSLLPRWKDQAKLSYFDLNHPLMSSITEKDGSRFIFVGFKEHVSDEGFMVVFQLCGSEGKSWVDYAISDYGLILNLDGEKQAFDKLDGPASLDLPRVCPNLGERG